MEKLKKHMEALRQELNQLMGEFDTCDKEKLLKVSRELDEVICKCQWPFENPHFWPLKTVNYGH